jgi:hypothetical protein
MSPSPENEDNFGRALAIQGDLLVVTARKSDEEEGAAYLFENKAGTWDYIAELTASDQEPGAYFGQSVALQGGVMAIGARNANPNAAGALYVFRQSGDGWEEVEKLTPQDGKKNDHFGFTVAIAGDTIAVGARRADPDGNKDAGAVYVYTLDGNAVDPVARLTAGEAGDEFGQSIAFAGNVLAVGAWKKDLGGNDDQGAIYLFRRLGNRWVETGMITASDGMSGDEFGYSLSAFGNRLVTGAHFVDFTSEEHAGAASVLPLKP